MELKPGYKRTEAGVIPEDWEVTKLSSLTSAPIQNGVFSDPSRKGKGYKLINVGDLYGATPIPLASLSKFNASKDEISRFGVLNGDIFFTRSSLTPDGIAHCNVYVGDNKGGILYDCHIIRVRSQQTKIDPLYLFRYCRSYSARRFLVTSAKTTTMTTIDQGVIASLPVSVPSLAEQHYIATALSDVDALISSLDQLIAKKRDIKHATMQQLLTGKQRLPGFGKGTSEGFPNKRTAAASFPKDWGVSTVGAQFEIQLGKMLDTDRNTGISKPYLGNKAVQWNCIDIADLPRMAMSPSDLEQFRLRRGDLLVCEGGEVGRAALWDAQLDECYYQKALHRLRPKNAFNSRFMLALLRYWVSQDLLTNYVTQTSIAHLTKEKLAEVPVPVPTSAEQEAIVLVLSEMDAEIAALEQRRDKSRALKQGMMQELLTGRIRLV